MEFSPATNPNSFSIGNHSSQLSIMSLQKIGSTPAYKLRKEFQKQLLKLSKKSEIRTINAI